MQECSYCHIFYSKIYPIIKNYDNIEWFEIELIRGLDNIDHLSNYFDHRSIQIIDIIIENFSIKIVPILIIIKPELDEELILKGNFNNFIFLNNLGNKWFKIINLIDVLSKIY